MSTDDEVAAYFNQHIVPIMFTVRRETEERSFSITTFVLSILDNWFLITAGHAIRDIEKVLASGEEIVRCRLMDVLGLGAKHSESIPFAYVEAAPRYVSDDLAYDYGIIPLSHYYRALLIANNVRPLGEETWKKQPTEVYSYYLLGVPNELVKIESETVELASVFYRVDRIDAKPEGFADTDVQQFYGRITLAGSGVGSIVGMSGGPILAFSWNEKGELRYWLTAIQSRWLSSSHYIAACPAALLGGFLEHMVNRNTW